MPIVDGGVGDAGDNQKFGYGRPTSRVHGRVGHGNDGCGHTLQANAGN